MRRYLVTVEHPSSAATVVMPVIIDEFMVDAPSMLDACLAVLDARDKGKANVERRRTHAPYTREYLKPDMTGISGAAAVAKDDLASVERALAKAGLDYAAERVAMIGRVAAAAAETDLDNSYDVVLDTPCSPTVGAANLRRFAETEWTDEDGHGRCYLRDLHDALARKGVVDASEVAIAEEAYWACTTSLMVERHGRENESSAAPAM